MTSMPDDPLRAFFETRIGEGEFPSAAWCVSKGGSVISEGAAGNAVVAPEKIAARIDTIYDIASITKPFAGALPAAIFQERNSLDLDEPVGSFIPEFARPDKERITVLDLLTHRSGLEAWRPLYLEVSGRDRSTRLGAVVSLIAGLPLECGPRTSVIYSDLNYIVLAALLEKISGKTLSTLFAEIVSEPLGLRDTAFVPGPEALERIAASEEGNKYEMDMAARAGFDTSKARWREGIIRGEVHDGNCSFLGGISAHAGLFSTVRDTVLLANQFLAGSKLLGEESLRACRADMTPGMGQARSVGFQLAASQGSSANGVLDDGAFGHLGFTGTTLWIEPESGSVYVAFTNRTHGRRPPFADLASTRREFLAIAKQL